MQGGGGRGSSGGRGVEDGGCGGLRGRGGDGHLRELFGGGPPAEPVGRGGLEPGQGESPRAGQNHRSLAALVNTHTAGDHTSNPPDSSRLPY